MREVQHFSFQNDTKTDNNPNTKTDNNPNTTYKTDNNPNTTYQSRHNHRFGNSRHENYNKAGSSNSSTPHSSNNYYPRCFLFCKGTSTLPH
jgi:hypothetical protein